MSGGPTMRLALTAEHARADTPVTTLCLSDDPARVHALARTADGWRLDDRDAATLAPLEGTAFDLTPDGPLRALAASPDGRRVAALFGRPPRSALHVVDRARGDAYAIEWAGDGARLAWSRDGRRLAASTRGCAAVLDAGSREVERSDAPDGQWLDWDGVTALTERERRAGGPRAAFVAHDVASGAERGRWEEPEGWALLEASLAGDGGFWAACLPAVEPGARRESRRAVRVSRHAPDGRELAHAVADLDRMFVDGWPMGGAYVIASERGVCAVARWDAAAAALRLDAPPEVTRPATLGVVNVQGVSRDGERYAGKVGAVPFVVDLARARAATLADGPSGMVTALALAPGGRRLAASRRGGVALVLDAETLTTEWTFEEGHDWLEACAFSPEGLTLYTLSERALRAWDLARGVEAASAPLDGLDNDLRWRSLDHWTLDVSPDGARAFALGRDEDDEDDVAIAVDLASFRVTIARPDPLRSLGESVDGAVGPWTALAVSAAPASCAELAVIALDTARCTEVERFEFMEAEWEGDERPVELDYGWLTLPADGEVAALEPRGPSPNTDSPWLVRWDLRGRRLRALRGPAGYTVSSERGLLVRVEGTDGPDAELVLRDAEGLDVVARHALDRLARPTAALLTADRRVLYVGTRRGAVMRFELREDDAP